MTSVVRIATPVFITCLLHCTQHIPMAEHASLTISLCFFRNQAYQTRIQLSILDHNKHCHREHMRSKDGNLLYHRKYRKQSKKWDSTPTLIRKKYEYIPRIMSEICKARADSDSSLKRKVVLAENHPGRIQKSIGHCNPEETHVIVSNKRSRFS